MRRVTDDPIHGTQDRRCFHGYYGPYCYLPLYIFAGEPLLCARQRPSDRQASAGALEEVARIVAQLRTAWPAASRPRQRQTTAIRLVAR